MLKKIALLLVLKILIIRKYSDGESIFKDVTDNYKNAEIVRQKKYLAAIEDLKSDKVDAVVMDELPAKEIISSNNGLKILEGSLANDSYGMVVKKGNSELLNIINKVLNRLKEEGKIEEFVIKHTS